MKRLGSFLMALILCAALAPPAFAAGDNAEQDDVTVENVEQGVVTIENAEAGDEYKFYQILAPDGSSGYDVSEAWKIYGNDPIIKVEDGSVFYLNTPGHLDDGWTKIKDSDPTSVGRLLSYVEWHSITPVVTITVPAESGTVRATLDYGYYLLDYGNGTGGLFYLDSPTKVIKKKTETEPSLKKEIVLADGKRVDWTTVQLGDKVQFEVTVKLPSAKEWANTPASYSCKIYDKVTSGLELNKDVKVIIDGETVITGTETVPDNNFVTGKCGDKTEADTIHVHYSDDSKKFDIGFGENYGQDGSGGGALEFLMRHPGAELTLSYTATVIQLSAQTQYEVNTVQLKYGEKSIYADVQMYDFTIVIEKRDKDTKEPLGGARFVLQNEDEKFYCSDIKLDDSYHGGDEVKWIDATYNSETGEFKLLDNSVDLDSVVLSTAVKETDANNSSGKNHFEGIPAGTYYLYEIEAPDGYDRLETPITIVIQPRVIQPTDGTEKVTYTYEGLGNKDLVFNRVVFESIIGEETHDIEEGGVPWGGDWHQLRLTVGVENSKDTFHLPSTGGMGTTIFYAVGGVLLVGAAVLLAAKRRTDGMD